MTIFRCNHRASHIWSWWTVHAWCIFVASIHPSRTWMSGSFESVRQNACVHRLDQFILSSERVSVKGVRNHVKTMGKIPSTRCSEEGRTCDAAQCRTASPTHWLSWTNGLSLYAVLDFVPPCHVHIQIQMKYTWLTTLVIPTSSAINYVEATLVRYPASN